MCLSVCVIAQLNQEEFSVQQQQPNKKVCPQFERKYFLKQKVCLIGEEGKASSTSNPGSKRERREAEFFNLMQTLTQQTFSLPARQTDGIALDSSFAHCTTTFFPQQNYFTIAPLIATLFVCVRFNMVAAGDVCSGAGASTRTEKVKKSFKLTLASLRILDTSRFTVWLLQQFCSFSEFYFSCCCCCCCCQYCCCFWTLFTLFSRNRKKCVGSSLAALFSAFQNFTLLALSLSLFYCTFYWYWWFVLAAAESLAL